MPSPRPEPPTLRGLDREALGDLYRTMLRSRQRVERALRHRRAGVAAAVGGREAIGAAIGRVLVAGRDWILLDEQDRTAPAEDPRRVVATSSSAVRFSFAVGCAEAVLEAPRVGERLQPPARGDEIVLVAADHDSSRGGAFWEASSTASDLKLPLVFVIEDGDDATGVPERRRSVSRSAATLPDLLIREVDGSDVLAVIEALAAAVDHARSRSGPALVHAHVAGASSFGLDPTRDPLVGFRAVLLRERILREDAIDKLEARTERETEPSPGAHSRASRPSSMATILTDPASHEPKRSGSPRTMAELRRLTLADEMRRDGRVVLLVDESVASGAAYQAETAFELEREFGTHRVRRVVGGAVGRACGMAFRGLRPVVQLDLRACRSDCFEELGARSLPVVALVGYGDDEGPPSAAPSALVSLPGLGVVCPTTALDAGGLLRTAIRGERPVVILEHRELLRQSHNAAAYPGPDYTVPLEQAAVVRPGTDLTVVTYGAMLHYAVEACRGLEHLGPEVELIDLRSLEPLDWETIRESVTKTSKLLVVGGGRLVRPYGAEVAARAAEQLYTELDGPVRRLTPGRSATRPAEIRRAILELAGW